MEKSGRILKDLPVFSPKGEEVYRALMAVQSGDKRVEIFAKRFARAVTRYEAGNSMKSGPLERFLLVGTSFSPIRLWVKTAAESWLGKPSDGSSSFICVDCSAFHTVYPGMLIPLIGSLSLDNSGFQPSPLFSQIEDRHLRARRGKDLDLLQKWIEQFQARWSRHIAVNSRQFYADFQRLVSEKSRAMYKEEQERNGPFGSVIFFEGINLASQPLQELVLQILHNGSLVLATGARVDFSNSIVIVSSHIDEKLVRRGDGIGFKVKAGAQEEDNLLREEYHKIRKELMNEIGGPAFVQGVAENLIVVSERTYDSQAERVKTELERIQNHFDLYKVHITFTGAFVEGFIEDTKEIVAEGNSKNAIYTEERIESGIKRHILDVLYRAVLFAKLRTGSSLRIDRIVDEKEFGVEATITEDGDGDGEVLTSEKMRVLSTQNDIEDQASWPEWLVELDEKVRELF
jgi:hypothetical protein